jgi:hypothetical protein
MIQNIKVCFLIKCRNSKLHENKDLCQTTITSHIYKHIASKLKGTNQNTSYQETSAANTCNWSNLPTWKNIRHQQLLLKFFINQVCLENVKTTEKIHVRPKTTHWNYGIKSPLNQRRAYLQGFPWHLKHSSTLLFKNILLFWCQKTLSSYSI